MFSSDYYNQNQNSTIHHHQQQQHQPGGSALARFRSAPSSFLAALLDSTGDNNSSSGDESEAMALFGLMSQNKNSAGNPNQMPQYNMKQEAGVDPESRPGYGNGRGSNMGYESAVSGGGGAIVGSYSVGMESQVHLRMSSNVGGGGGGGTNNGNSNISNRNVNNGGSSSSSSSSNLVRQSSSPAGFFNGFGVMGEIGNYRVHNHAEANSSSAGGLSNHINFSSSGPSSSSRFMPSIPENGNETENGQLRSGQSTGNNREFEPTFPHNGWNDSPSFNGLKRNRDGDPKMFSSFSGLENQNGESRKNISGLVHHLSLPKTSSELDAAEKFLQFQQDTVPCQIRAKRGCATHPRSIAERIRRTRISEKMKKLQDLFPNMDKQANTADMLDLAVEYIKDLQQQVQTLNETRAKCVCPSKPQQTSPTK